MARKGEGYGVMLSFGVRAQQDWHGCANIEWVGCNLEDSLDCMPGVCQGVCHVPLHGVWSCLSKD